jgi:hypothetical protein
MAFRNKKLTLYKNTFKYREEINKKNQNRIIYGVVSTFYIKIAFFVFHIQVTIQYGKK